MEVRPCDECRCVPAVLLSGAGWVWRPARRRRLRRARPRPRAGSSPRRAFQWPGPIPLACRPATGCSCRASLAVIRRPANCGRAPRRRRARPWRTSGAVLKAAGMDHRHLVKCHVYLASMDDYAAMNEAYTRFFSGRVPARTTIEAAGLPREAAVEIACIAYGDLAGHLGRAASAGLAAGAAGPVLRGRLGRRHAVSLRHGRPVSRGPAPAGAASASR